MRERPLSPHLSVYRFAHTMVLSITHRITGLLLALGLPILVWWLMSAASGESTYQLVVTCLGSWPGKLLLLGWLAAFLYHLCNGVRHLLWDTGHGLEKIQARRSARVVVVVAVLAFLILAWELFASGGAA